MKPLFILLLTAFPFIAYAQKNMDTYEKIWKMAEINKNQRTVGEPYVDSLNHTHIGQDYIPFALTTLNWETITNRNSVGKITLIVSFIQTCDGCWDFVTLNKLYTTLKDNPAFQMVAVTFEKDNINEFIKKYNIQFPITFVSNSFELRQLVYDNGEPSFVILDKNGKVALLKDEGIGVANTYSTISLKDFQKIIGMLL